MTRPTYQVELVRQARKDYEAIPKEEREAVKKGILSLEREPRGRQVKKLEDRDYYRLRISDWRVFFALSDKLKKVTVLQIERRSSTTYR